MLIFFFFNGREKKESQIKISSRDSTNSSPGSYGDDDIIIWRGYITRAKATGQSPTSEESTEACSVTTLHYSFPTCSVAFLGLGEHALIGHWKKALRGVRDSQAPHRALLKKEKKKAFINHSIKFEWSLRSQQCKPPASWN